MNSKRHHRFVLKPILVFAISKSLRIQELSVRSLKFVVKHLPTIRSLRLPALFLSTIDPSISAFRFSFRVTFLNNQYLRLSWTMEVKNAVPIDLETAWLHEEYSKRRLFGKTSR
jgi:hypothetical protein